MNGAAQAAYRTYETQAARAGVPFAGEKEPLTPLSHMMANAHIEITLNMDGHFQSAVPVPKEDCKTIIPVTVASANRTGDNTKAHPLSDQLRYLAPFGGEKFAAYLEQLNRWAGFPLQPSQAPGDPAVYRRGLHWSAILPRPGSSHWTKMGIRATEKLKEFPSINVLSAGGWSRPRKESRPPVGGTRRCSAVFPRFMLTSARRRNGTCA